ncbi:hypothetical protein [Lactococcus allomyrinae]|uniref:Uncharacterized protein n=1 Tax=Lactococcus allomyrinae TaxID=2419773 RepID=A0A387BIV4_9LACT|nr:hypothetical protein [Lactococcus allomyrinae]AYG01036.1 hypothetical protein D7I46_08020 [Lactococcus allomyrinae]
MKAKFDDEVVEVWEISRENDKPDWVSVAFAGNKLYWTEKIATNFSENISGSWLNDHTKPVYRPTNSKSANTIALAGENQVFHGKFGEFLLKKSENDLAIVTREALEF